MSEVIESVDLRGLAERDFQRLLKSGPGVHAYALHKADAMEKEYPWHEGLVAFVEKQIGPVATIAARRDIHILLGKTERNPTTRSKR